MKQKITELKGEMRNSIINEDFNPSVLAYDQTITDTEKENDIVVHPELILHLNRNRTHTVQNTLCIPVHKAGPRILPSCSEL